MKKHTLALLLAFCMVTSMITPAFAGGEVPIKIAQSENSKLVRYDGHKDANGEYRNFTIADLNAVIPDDGTYKFVAGRGFEYLPGGAKTFSEVNVEAWYQDNYQSTDVDSDIIYISEMKNIEYRIEGETDLKEPFVSSKMDGDTLVVTIGTTISSSDPDWDDEDIAPGEDLTEGEGPLLGDLKKSIEETLHNAGYKDIEWLGYLSDEQVGKPIPPDELEKIGRAHV